jgi:hypothetical protein
MRVVSVPGPSASGLTHPFSSLGSEPVPQPTVAGTYRIGPAISAYCRFLIKWGKFSCGDGECVKRLGNAGDANWNIAPDIELALMREWKDL